MPSAASSLSAPTSALASKSRQRSAMDWSHLTVATITLCAGKSRFLLSLIVAQMFPTLSARADPGTGSSLGR